jgi:hypothetical protein
VKKRTAIFGSNIVDGGGRGGGWGASNKHYPEESATLPPSQPALILPNSGKYIDVAAHATRGFPRRKQTA